MDQSSRSQITSTTTVTSIQRVLRLIQKLHILVILECSRYGVKLTAYTISVSKPNVSNLNDAHKGGAPQHGIAEAHHVLLTILLEGNPREDVRAANREQTDLRDLG